jgi:hypothetical protein
MRRPAFLRTIAVAAFLGAPAAAGWIACADERQGCAVSGTEDVGSAAGTRSSTPRQVTGGAACENAVVGDTSYRGRKRCDRRPVQRTSPRPPSSPGRPFPRLMMVHSRIIDAADRDRLARWDWVVVSGADPTTVCFTPSLRRVNPNIKITPYVNASEDNGYNTNPRPNVSPTAYSTGFSDSWWLKNADGTYAQYPHSPGRKMIDITSFSPLVRG